MFFVDLLFHYYSTYLKHYVESKYKGYEGIRITSSIQR